MTKLLELYRRYNQFGIYKDFVPVDNQYTIINLYREMKNKEIDINVWLEKHWANNIKTAIECKQGLSYDNELIQPKSIFLRIHLLNIVANAIPQSAYNRMEISANIIVDMTMAIALYYFGLQTYMFYEIPITDTQKKNIIRNQNFYIELADIKMVRGNTSEKELDKYLKLFAKDIYDIDRNKNIGLFLDNGNIFIICIEDFVDYILFETERIFKGYASEKEYDLYVSEKGTEFERMVVDISNIFFDEVYHTLFYYPNSKQEMEIDALIKSSEHLAILECKSGTFNIEGINEDSAIELKIKNKSQKAYKTLKNVSKYLAENELYSFKYMDQIVSGRCNSPVCLHISMYSMDFISSNLHALFPDYLNANPIFTISIEHFFAMLLEAKKTGKDIFSYWEIRKKDVEDYPGIYFDNNELDLYYELTQVNDNLLFPEFKKQGFLEHLNTHGHVFFSFHNQYGHEVRPAQEMIRQLDTYLLLGIFEKGKSWFGINKRYLKNLEEYLRIV